MRVHDIIRQDFRLAIVSWDITKQLLNDCTDDPFQAPDLQIFYMMYK